MPWTVYCHIHRDSGRRYVGLTRRTWKQRWKDHVYAAKRSKGGRWHFPNAIRKYGKDAFDHEVLEICETLEEGNAAEEKWIEHFDTRNPEKGFNLAKGGNHIPHSVRNPWDRPEYREKCTKASRERAKDPAHRAKCRQAALTAWKDPEYRKRASECRKDVPLSPEHRSKLSEAGKGKTISPETRGKISSAQKGKPRNPDSIARSAASRKGRKLSPELRELAVQTLRSHTHSPETIAKIAASLRARPKAATCSHGHSLEDAYVISGRRYCRTCRLKTCAAYHERKRMERKLRSTLD
jgi:hypothetical protein